MKLNAMTDEIRKAIFEVHKTLGPGLFESVYEQALLYDINLLRLKAQQQVGLLVIYKGREVEMGFRIGILLEGNVIIEIKSIETLLNVHKKQLNTYLKLSGKKLGVLVNLNVNVFVNKENLIRIIN